MTRKFKKCLITGITGSGGSYLAEYILKKSKNTKITGYFRSQGYKKLLEKKYNKKISFFRIDMKNFSIVKKKIN